VDRFVIYRGFLAAATYVLWPKPEINSD